MIQNDSAKIANDTIQGVKDSSLVQDTSYVKGLVDEKMNQFESTADKIKSFANIDLSILDLVYAALIVVILYGLLTGLKKILRYQIEKNNLHHGNIMAVYKIIKYFTIVIGTMMVLNALGFNTTVLLTSSAALFIGLGLGIQTLFRDIVSGFVILFSKSIRIGDVVQVGDLVGQVKEITLRVTKIITRSDIDLIVPNSKFVEENVINWSLDNPLTRFDIEVGVAYGSNVQLVTDILNEVVESHKSTAKAPKHFVRFENFGDSALIFKVYFWSNNVFRIENVKSDLRYRIDEEFRKNEITIPFPQRTVWMEK